jgi:hypothetical protein
MNLPSLKEQAQLIVDQHKNLSRENLSDLYGKLISIISNLSLPTCMSRHESHNHHFDMFEHLANHGSQMVLEYCNFMAQLIISPCEYVGSSREDEGWNHPHQRLNFIPLQNFNP